MTRFNVTRNLLVLAAVGPMLGLAGCPSSSSGGGGGTLSVAVTDTPVDGAQKVVVAFTGVEVHGTGGTTSYQLKQEKSVNLLKLQGDNSEVLISNSAIPSGNFQWIRLDLDLANSYVVASDGSQYPLNVPSGDETGLKLVSGFTVAEGGSVDFMVDFDLRRSLKKKVDPNGNTEYILNPTLRLIDMQSVGTIDGTAAGDMTVGTEPISDPACSPAVYVYSGAITNPEGFYVTVSGGTPPLTSANLTLNSDTGNYDYTAGFLVPGQYTLAVTCAAQDTEGGTSLQFSATKLAMVGANQTATVDFP